MSGAPSSRGRLALSLLGALARDARVPVAVDALLGDADRRWLGVRQLDSLLDLGPLQAVYDRVWRHQRAALVEVADALERRGVQALAFKGAELLLRSYGERSLSAIGDVDLLVPAGEQETARAVLHALGFAPAHFDFQRRDLVRLPPARVAEIERGHYELAQHVRLEPFALDAAEQAALEDCAGKVPVFPAEDGDGWVVGVAVDVHYAVATNIDGARFFPRADPGSAGSGLSMSVTDLVWFTISRYYTEVALDAKRSLRDLAYVIPLVRDRHRDVDWDLVRHETADLQLGASLFYYLTFFREVLGLPVPEEVTRAAAPWETTRRRDWGWQLGVLFEFLEPAPFDLLS